MARLICIGCPQGCTLEVEPGEGEALRVSGARCNRGREYARTELTDPRRTITTTVRVRGGVRSLVPVRSAAPVPKRSIARALREVKGIVLQAPVGVRQVVDASVAGTGIAVLTVGSVARDESTKDTGSVADQ